MIWNYLQDKLILNINHHRHHHHHHHPDHEHVTSEMVAAASETGPPISDPSRSLSRFGLELAFFKIPWIRGPNKELGDYLNFRKSRSACESQSLKTRKKIFWIRKKWANIKSYALRGVRFIDIFSFKVCIVLYLGRGRSIKVWPLHLCAGWLTGWVIIVLLAHTHTLKKIIININNIIIIIIIIIFIVNIIIMDELFYHIDFHSYPLK